MSDLLDMAVRACKAAEAAGADQAQVSISKGRYFSTSLEKGAIKTSQMAESAGAMIRAFYRGGVGTANADSGDATDIKQAAETAAALSRQADPDPDFVSLPGPAPLPEVEGLFDERIAGVSVTDATRIALDATDEALAVAPEAIISGGVGVRVGDVVLANSLGIAIERHSTMISAYISAVVRRGDDVGIWFEHTFGRVMDDFKPEGIGKEAAEVALTYLGARDIPSGDYPVILGPQASPSLYYAIAAQANAEDVQRNRSYLIGKRGEQVASDVLTVIDDPLIPRGGGSSACDSEGVPRRPLTIVEDGVLKSYLHNSYTANKSGEENTGHAAGGGIGPTNVNVTLGSRLAAEIVADVDDGIYISGGGPSPDAVTGDYSSTVDFGFKIENGEIAYPIRNAAIGGSFLELLQGIEEVSSDYREEPGEKMPTIRVNTVRLAGGG